MTNCPDFHVDKIQGQLGGTRLGEPTEVLSEQFNRRKTHPACEHHYVVWRSRLNTEEEKTNTSIHLSLLHDCGFAM